MKILRITAVLLALVMLASCGVEPRTPNEPEITKSTATQELMSADDILEIAIDHAKSSAEGAVAEALADGIPTDTSAEFTAKNGIPIYDCKFRISQFEFEYEVDQQVGAIRSYIRKFDSNSETALGTVDEDTAIYYALWYLDIKEADIKNASSKYSQLFNNYIVGFTYNGHDYKCMIASATGEFIRSNRDIGTYGAKNIAYDHVHLNAAEDQQKDLTNLILAGMITDDGAEVKGIPSERMYEVRFKVGGFAYKYVIDGLSGAILSVECEPDDDWSTDSIGGFDANTVSLSVPEQPDYFAEDTAVDTVMNDVQSSWMSLSNAFMHAETDDNGHAYYSISFYLDGYMYFYDVDAETSDILRKTCEDNNFAQIPEAEYGDISESIGYIGEQSAKSAALEHAGVSEADANDISVELKSAKGVENVYVVRFDAADNEYEYIIGAENGDILKAVRYHK